MKTIYFATILSFLAVSNANAQKIDFGNNNANTVETGYDGWGIGNVDKDEPQTKEFSIPDTDRKISITVTYVPGLKSNGIGGNWWKQGIQAPGSSKMINDGLYALYFEGGNRPNLTNDKTGLQFTITGLPAGTHTLTAYHNITDGSDSATPIAAPLDVIVNGETVQKGIVPTWRAETELTSAFSYIKFEAKEGEPVVLQYVTQPEEGKTYATSLAVVNAFIFDGANPSAVAMNPSPANYELHADADNGYVTLSWEGASDAVKHHLYVGDSESSLKEVASLTETSYKLYDLYSMNTYYWRVDEEHANGKIYKGEVWNFRPRHLAFPDAEGYGRFATGGRGGMVYHVTRLEDDEEPGSFRYGITKLTGPRTIVFDVSGIIALKSRLTSSDKYVTIACQTAPGHGICFSQNPFGVGPESIVRFMRLRKGAGETADGIGMAGSDNSILDHASISWTIDEAFSSRNAHNMTLQRTMISEALGVAGHKNYPAGTNHGYAATIGGDIASFHHNLLAHCYGRNWSMGGGLDGGGSYAGRLDIFNNVVYNWGHRATDGGAHEVNFVGNYYKMGPATDMRFLLSADLEGTGKGTQSYYVNGNIREEANGNKVQDKAGDTYRYTLSGGQELTWQPFVSEPFFPSYAKVESAEEAYKSVLSDVGATMPFLDAHDQRIVTETLKRSYTYTGSKTGLKGQIDTEADCGGYEVYPEEHRAADFDSDQDGIPNWYEALIGSDVNVANNNADPDKDGYTQLEDYLEFISHPYLIIEPSSSEDIDLAQYFRGYTSSPSFSANSSSANVKVEVNGDKLHVDASSAGLATISLKVTDAAGASYERLFNIAVSDASTGIQAVGAKTFNVKSYEVYSLDGVKMYSNSSANGADISNLPMKNLQSQQTYILKAKDENGKQHVMKIIKK